MLVLQYDIGVFLNLYVPLPASDKGAGLPHEIATAPFALALHATLGLALIGVAVVLLLRTAALPDRTMMALAALALASICGAFIAGEMFVHSGGAASFSSFAMAALTGIALVCYVGTLALTSLRRRRPVREDPWLPYDPGPARWPAARPWEAPDGSGANGRPRPASPPRHPPPRRPPPRPPQPRSPLSESVLWEPTRREWPRPAASWDREPGDDPPYRSR
jgi:hypothetical protein